jgi:hypothetical protein
MLRSRYKRPNSKCHLPNSSAPLCNDIVLLAMQSPILLLTSLVAADPTSPTHKSKSEVDIFPLSTAILAITQSMDFSMLASSLPTSTAQDCEAKRSLPQTPASSPQPAIEAPHTRPGSTHSSAPGSKSKSLATPSTHDLLTLPSYLQWVISSLAAKTSAKSLRNSVSDLSSSSESTLAYEGIGASITASSQAVPEGFGGDTGDDQWMLTRPANTPKTSASESGAPESNASKSGAPVISMLWQPPKSNSARRLGVPKLLLGLLSLRAVVAGNLERVEPAMTFAAGSALVATPTVSPDHSLPPSTETLTCPQGQDGCGRGICYDPKALWCCPDKLNVCQKSEVCAKANTGHGDWVYGCGPSDVTNGDPRMHTTSVYTSNADVRATTTGIPTTLSTATGEASTSNLKSTPTTGAFSYPTKSGGSRLNVPSILPKIVLLVRSARAAAFASPLRPECCGDICCNLDEVCARSSTGPKCWPKAGQPVARSEPEEEDTISREITLGQSRKNDVAPLDEETRPGNGESKVVVPAAAAAAAAAAGAARARPHKKGSAARPTTPSLFYMFLLLMPFVAANLSPSLLEADRYGPVAGVPQTDTSTEATTNKRWFFEKRWSCHKPNQNCGSSGCWDPASDFCCNQPDGKYGLCAASKGEVCCGKMCCPENTEYHNEGDFLCYLKNSS